MKGNVGYRRLDAWSRPDVLTATFFVNVLGLVLPMSILQVYDRIIPNAAYDTFAILIFIVAGAIVLEAVFKILRARIFSAVGARYEHQTRTRAMSHLLETSRHNFGQDSPGSYSEKMHSIQSQREFYSGQIASLAIDIPFVFLFLLLIVAVAGILVFIPIVLLAMLAGIIYLLNKDLTRAIHNRIETDRRRHNFLIETLQGVHIVKALGLERLMLRRYERLQARSSKGVVDFSVLQSTSASLAALFSQLAMVSYVSFGSVFVISGDLTLGGLAAGTMLTGRVLQPVIRGLNLWNRYQDVRIANVRLQEIYDLPPESPPGSLSRHRLHGDIELQNVSFRHKGATQNIWTDINLKIPRDAMIGITGPNGSGLSTFLDLISGACHPTGGRILVDGCDIACLDHGRLRQQIGLIPEEGAIFNGTLLENLSLFRGGDYKVRAIEALRLVGLEEYVLSLPKGLETRLGGTVQSNMPLGVQQRIVIARTLVNNPSVVLFDNANSGLDIKSDTHLRQALEIIRQGRTVVVATYRPSYLEICDRVYSIENKKLVPTDKAGGFFAAAAEAALVPEGTPGPAESSREALG